MAAPGRANRGSHSKNCHIITLLVIFALVLPLIITVGRLVGQKSEQQCLTVPSHVACPAHWLNYEGKCYFFSEEERSWTSGQSFCALNGSSLVVIESETEKEFMLRYMNTTGHWIGLWKDPDQIWRWADGTEFNNTLEVRGEAGDCAFLSTGFAMASDCHRRKKWICSQPDAYTRSKGPTKGE